MVAWSIWVQLFWGTVIEVSSWAQVMAKKTIASWKFVKFKGKDERKFLAKFRKASKPISVGVMGVFEIKRLTVPKFFRGIIKGTFRALLTIGK